MDIMPNHYNNFAPHSYGGQLGRHHGHLTIDFMALMEPSFEKAGQDTQKVVARLNKCNPSAQHNDPQKASLSHDVKMLLTFPPL